MLDFNDAGPQQDFSPLPNGTLVPVIAKLRPGGIGQDGSLTQSRNSDAQYLDFEFTVTRGEHKNRKFWQMLTVSGGKVDEQGQSKAGIISRTMIRAILNSSAGVGGKDDSDRARQARAISNYHDLSGKEFAVRLGIQKGQDGYKDKNQIDLVIEGDNKDYVAIMAGEYQNTVKQAAPAFAGGQAPACQQPAAPAPSWSQPTAPAAPAQPTEGQQAAGVAPPPHVQQQPQQPPQQPPASGGQLPGWAG